MSVFIYRVDATGIIYADAQIGSAIGPLAIKSVSIRNQVKKVNQSVIKVTLFGKNVITTKTNIISPGVVIQTQKIDLLYKGIKSARLKYTRVTPNRIRVSGTINGKPIVPYFICNDNSCTSPSRIRFKDGSVLRITIAPRAARALTRLYKKYIDQLRRADANKKGMRTSRTYSECVNCLANACASWGSFGVYLCIISNIPLCAINPNYC